MKTIKLTILLALSCSLNHNSQIVFSETFSTSLGQCAAANGSGGNWIFFNSCSYSSSSGHSASGHAIFREPALAAINQ